MIQFMLDFFTSFFQNPTGWGIGLALAFGAVWLAPFVPLPKNTGLRVPTLAGVLLLVFISSAFLALAAFLHCLTNYSAVLFAGGYLTPLQVEIYLAIVALGTVAIALWLRWRPQRQQPLPTFRESEEEPARSGR